MNIRSLFNISLLAVLALTAGAINLGAAEDAKQPDGEKSVLSRIMASWQERRATVHALSGKAKIECFYPRGSLSDEMRAAGDEVPDKWDFPEADKWVTGGQLSWDIDIETPRVKKEEKGTVPVMGIATCEFRNADHLYIYNHGKLRDFRLHERTAEERLSDPDVFSSGECGVQSIIQQHDFPLAWLCGGVNGESYGKEALNYLPKETAWSFRGSAKWKDVECYLLTIPEQRDKVIVREFWVATQPPFPILACRFRFGEVVKWQLEVSYNKLTDDRPIGWELRTYSGAMNKLASIEAITLEDLTINPSFASDQFEKSFEPGMTVYHVPENYLYQVDQAGKLGEVDFQDHEHRRSHAVWIVGVLAAVILLTGLWLLWRKIRRPSRATGL